MLKVIVTGAYSTGKTSLVEKLTATLRNDGHAVEQVSDTARTCPFPLNSAQTELGTLWLITTQIAREIEAEGRDADIVMCDRGIPDILAHAQEVRSKSATGMLDQLATFLANWSRSYDLILFSRIDEDIPVLPDNLRVEDASYRARLEEFAVRSLEGLQNVIELPQGDIQRLAYARDAILPRLRSDLPSRCSST